MTTIQIGARVRVVRSDRLNWTIQLLTVSRGGMVAGRETQAGVERWTDAGHYVSADHAILAAATRHVDLLTADETLSVGQAVEVMRAALAHRGQL